jgi:hypothetical protein
MHCFVKTGKRSAVGAASSLPAGAEGKRGVVEILPNYINLATDQRYGLFFKYSRLQ